MSQNTVGVKGADPGTSHFVAGRVGRRLRSYVIGRMITAVGSLLILSLFAAGALPGCAPFAGGGSSGNGNSSDGDPGNGDPLNGNETPNDLDVDNIQSATWMLLVASDLRAFTATAFAVGPDLFATAADMTESIKLVYLEPDPMALLYQHNTGASRIVREVWTHPEFQATAPLMTTPDVGLLATEPAGEGAADFAPLSPAGNEQLLDLSALDVISLCGFSANVIDAEDTLNLVRSGQQVRPRSLCLQGVISLLIPFDQNELATPENSFMLQYDVVELGGFTGAPLFDPDGKVLGIHLLTFGAGLNFGVRSDKLSELIALVESGELEGTTLTEISTCQTSYYISEWAFGFDLPVGFAEASSPSGAFLFGIDFEMVVDQEVVAQMRSRVFEPSGSLTSFVDAYVAALENSGIDVLREQFTTANGRVAESLSYLTVGAAGGDVVAESWVSGLFGHYNVRGSTATADPAGVAESLQDATLTICTDAGG